VPLVARTASLEPYTTNRKTRKWCVDVPPHLSGTGRRKRLFFETKAAATGECERLKARRDNFGVSLTSLTPARIAAAAEAYKLLDPQGIDLLDAVRSYLGIREQRNRSKTFGHVFDQFADLKKSKSPKYRQEISHTRGKFKHLFDRLLCDLTSDDLEQVLNNFKPSVRNARMRRLRSVFNLAIRKKWMPAGSSPIAEIDFADTEKREVQVYSPAEVERMLSHALSDDLALLPFLTLAFFTGVRPEGELTRINWSDIHFEGDTPQVIIRSEVSKTKRRRFVDLAPNAVAWLHTYRDHGGAIRGRIVPFGPNILRKKRRANREAAKVKVIQQGARHTYCSMWLAKYEDANKLVLQSGHTDAQTMWDHYHRGVTRDEADKFWAIHPPLKGERKIIRLPA
jgi:integrase